jgi:hypothetical protein
VVVKHDRATARHRGVAPVTEFALKLTVPLWHEDELCKVIFTRLERTPLPAPSVGLELCVTHLSAAIGKQLELSRLAAGFSGKGAPGDERGLDVLLSELTGEVGASNVGVLTLVDSFLPEKQGILVGLTPAERARRPHEARVHRRAATSAQLQVPRSAQARRVATQRDVSALADKGAQGTLALGNAALPAAMRMQPMPPLRKTQGRLRMPTRLFRRPLSVIVGTHGRAAQELPPTQSTGLRVGATIIVEHECYVIERLRFDHRLKNVEWWGDHPVSRDYVWLLLAGAVGKLEAFAYIDSNTGQVFVQGIRD